jgi:hypothetical protein
MTLKVLLRGFLKPAKVVRLKSSKGAKYRWGALLNFEQCVIRSLQKQQAVC